MPIQRPPVTVVTVLLMFAILLCPGFVSDAKAQHNTLRIGAHVSLDTQWAQNTSAENRKLVAALKAHTQSGRIEALPNDRLYHLYRTAQFDCILTGGWPHDDPQLRSERALMFEVRLFTLPDSDLTTQDQILVGRMKQFPPPVLPLEKAMVDWLPLQNLKQGFDLLRAGRIDALIADPSHVQNHPGGIHQDVTQADLPPLKRFAVPLICHDTANNRNFIEMLDRSAMTQ